MNTEAFEKTPLWQDVSERNGWGPDHLSIIAGWSEEIVRTRPANLRELKRRKLEAVGLSADEIDAALAVERDGFPAGFKRGPKRAVDAEYCALLLHSFWEATPCR
jgi:hypothetical protein